MAIIQITQTMTEQEERETQNTNNAFLDAQETAHEQRTDNPHGVTASQAGAVPTARKVAGIALSADITLAQLGNLLYPIGSIRMSTSATNPSTYLGGTWVAWGTGRVPVGVDTSQTEFNTVEKTGGEKTHLLSTDETPFGSIHASGSEAAGFGLSASGAFTDRALVTGAGGGAAHNNLQPYITCYMWKRTA